MTTEISMRAESSALSRLEFFGRNEAGNVAPVFGLMAIAMFLMIGGAIDLGRWLHARHVTIRAMDSAVLAGGRMLQISSMDETQAMDAAKRFYEENTKERLPLKTDTIRFLTADNGTSVTAEGEAVLETTFLKLASIDEISLVKLTKSEYSKAVLAVGGNAESSVEVSLMLDVSGSMSGDKVADMKAAAIDLVNIVVWEDQSQYTSRVAIAPFSQDVRVPAAIQAKVRGNGPFNNKSVGGKTYRVSNCMSERKGAQRYTDAAPSSGQFVMPEYTTNGSCSIPTSAEIMPLTSSKSTLISKINGLAVGGGTAGHLGTAWAWYTLSPNWKNVFTGGSEPASYALLNEKGKQGQPKLRKIAVLMTDGEYNTEFDTDGIRTSTSGRAPVNGTAVNQALALCQGMKNAGITVYTVGFDLGGNQTAINTLSSCATDPTTFYNTSGGEQLKQAFRDIALKISSLYLSK